MSESGCGFGLEFMRKSILKKFEKKNENYRIRWFPILCIFCIDFA